MNLPVRRTRENAVIAGVCAGLARRWNIDPILLRIALLVACLASGLGVVAYGVAVLVLPTDGTSEPPVHRFLPFTRSWPMPALVLGLGAAGFILFGIAGGWSGVGFLPIPVALGIWYAVSRKRGDARTTTADPTPYERAAEAWRDRLLEHQVNSGALPATALAVTNRPAAPDAGQVAAARDLVPVSSPPRRRGRGLWWLALGLSAIGIVTAALLGATGGLPYLGVILVSLGITLLLGTWLGRPRLMGTATVLVLVSTLITWAAPTADRLEALEIADGKPQVFASAEDLPSEISASVGKLPLDLSGLTLTTDTELAISLGAGEVFLNLPDTVNSEVVWSVGVGDAVVPGKPEVNGSTLSGTTPHVTGPGRPTLRINVSVGAGSLEVTP